jgi:hypothetical protein
VTEIIERATFMALVCRELDRQMEMEKAVESAGKLIGQLEKTNVPIGGVLAAWAPRFGVELARRELEKLKTASEADIRKNP